MFNESLKQMNCITALVYYSTFPDTVQSINKCFSMQFLCIMSYQQHVI